MSRERQSGQFVVPGQKLGVIEEFIPDQGTYVEEGAIHSKSVGFMLMDFANKKVSVYPAARNLNVPQIGNIVAGDVVSSHGSQAIIEINKVGDKKVSGRFSGMIHVSDVSFRYTENMFDAFKPGDLVRAKVISDKNKVFHLSTKDENLGVLYAYCSLCGGTLMSSRKQLRCKECGHLESRKTAADYGLGTL